MIQMFEDGDGQVTEDEFVQSYLEQRDFSKMLALKVIDIIVDDNSYEIYSKYLPFTFLSFLKQIQKFRK